MKLNIGKNIKKLREDTKVTQEQLAVALNISFQAVSKWENGIAVPDTMMLPQLADYFHVTIDDLFKTEIKAYENTAIRLLSVYESSRKQDDFYRADIEFSKLIAGGNYTENDLRSYGILYEYHTYYCINKALELYQQGLDYGSASKTEVYYQIQRQRIGMLSKIGRGQESIERHSDLLRIEPDNVENHICLILAYYYEKQYEKAIELFDNAILTWPENELLYVFSGDICHKQKNYDKAFEYWNKVLEMNGEISDVMYSMAFCYQELGDKVNEKKMWEKIADWLDKRGFTIEADLPKKMLADI